MQGPDKRFTWRQNRVSALSGASHVHAHVSHFPSRVRSGTNSLRRAHVSPVGKKKKKKKKKEKKKKEKRKILLKPREAEAAGGGNWPSTRGQRETIPRAVLPA